MFVSVIFWGFVDMMLYQIPPQPGGATIAFKFETVACFGTPLLILVPTDHCKMAICTATQPLHQKVV